MLPKVTILPSVRHPVRSVLPRLTLVFRMAAWPTSLVRYVLTIVRRACAPGIGGGGTCSTASDRIETHFGSRVNLATPGACQCPPAKPLVPDAETSISPLPIEQNKNIIYSYRAITKPEAALVPALPSFISLTWPGQKAP
jgi:hypothetical protein